MKRAVVAAGAFALGAVGLYGANVDGLTAQEKSKWWIVSGSLRSFFDDNIFNSPNRSRITSNPVQSSFGLEAKPGIGVNLPLEQTLIHASYDYTLTYYEARASQKIDQTHLIDARLNHKFSGRVSLDVTDRLVISDEPAITGTVQSVFRSRLDASNIRNSLTADITALMLPTFGWIVGYNNSFQDYRNAGYSKTLDLIGETYHVDARWFLGENTLVFTGYQFGINHYTGGFLYRVRDESGFPYTVSADIKDSRSHYVYLGAKHEITRRLQVSSRVGMQYSDYYNNARTTWSPYVDVDARYTYRPESTVRLGANVARYPSDVPVSSSGNVTLDQQIETAYMSVSHALTARVVGTCDFRFQHSTFNGGFDDGKSDSYYSVSVGAEYKIRQSLFANVSYEWRQLSSGRAFARDIIDFSRNLVYWGVRASF